MKITRRQLRQLINEELGRVVKESKAMAAASDRSSLAMVAGMGAGGGAGIGASAALGLSGAAGPAAAVVALIGLGIISADTMIKVEKAQKKATAQRISDILKRTMSMSLKKLRQKGMTEEESKIAHQKIVKGSSADIIGQIKAGNIDIDLTDLQRVHNDMKSSASEEYISQKAIEKMLDEIRDSLS